MRRVIPAVLAATFAALALSAPAGARQATASTTLYGKVGAGDAFTISLTRAGGHALGTLKAGTYTFKVTDSSSFHNFHLKGPGVSRATSVSGKGSATWSVKLKKGTYTVQCDPHAGSMRRTFKVS